ncbi:hypothetical protein K502DRAFT_347160 [Neoconidiobolus thromboides FSU 785]|nr:hypothetical protein K502DRAFT_347160 [Neoconidiobolus thromboides FSU 785]
MLKFEDLSDIILEEILNSVSPYELIRLRTLNRFFNKFISIMVFNKRCNSIPAFYIDDEFRDKFITRNGNNMNHLSVGSNDNIQYLKLCPNISSLSVYCYNDLNELGLAIASNPFPRLRTLKLEVSCERPEFITFLLIIKLILYNIENLHIERFKYKLDEVINYINPNKLDEVVSYLNPDKLKVLNFRSLFGSIVDLDSLKQIKNELKGLKLLSVTCYKRFYNRVFDDLVFYESPTKFNITLKHFNGYLNQYKDLSKFNEIYIDTINEEFDFRILDKINKHKIRALGYINPTMLELIDLKVLSNLKKVSIMEKDELPSIIASISSVLTIHTIELCFLEQVFKPDKLISLRDFDLRKIKHTNTYYHKRPLNKQHFIQCSFIKQLTFVNCFVSLQDIFDVLYLFPNIESVTLKKFTFKKCKEKIVYSLSNPILFQFIKIQFECNKTEIMDILNKDSLITLIK